jgi:hypothetical protein
LDLAALQPLHPLAQSVFGFLSSVEGISDMERIAFRYRGIMDELQAGN